MDNEATQQKIDLEAIQRQIDHQFSIMSDSQLIAKGRSLASAAFVLNWGEANATVSELVRRLELAKDTIQKLTKENHDREIKSFVKELREEKKQFIEGMTIEDLKELMDDRIEAAKVVIRSMPDYAKFTEYSLMAGSRSRDTILKKG